MNDFTPPGRRASGEGAAPERLRVLLADGQPLLREGVRAVLRREDDMEVVGDASDGSEVPGLVEQLQPDVWWTS